MTKNELMKIIKGKKVGFVRLWFTDVLGFLKSFDMPVEELAGAVKEGMGFDGSSIEGFSRIEESDMIVKPDLGTFQILPWIKEEKPVARMFCNVLEPSGKPFSGDPRYVLKRNLEEAKKMGYTFNVGPELEYFYFRNTGGTEILDRGGYFD
ncbi:MAG: glutamine synthetase beta-grasp domain-containing protein, partial [Candidatus Omnitrophica bacterium]|nr:glutamine synthetase beta-grasp domain-containing protein [Candidatus Omnitrophota bacterium]